MLQTVLLNKKGLTLVEVMIALVVLLLVFLALMQTALVSIDSNMVNALRDEAVNIAEEKMNEARNTSFTALAAVTTDVSPPPKSLRNIAAFTYTATRTVSDISANSKQVVISVTWEWKDKTVANGTEYRHTISTVLRRQ
jgi:type IV pilus assembly protein PilV